MAVAVAGCGGDRAATSPLRVPEVRLEAPRLTVAATQRLPIGLTEANPALLWHPEARPAPPGFTRARDVVHAVRPSRVRVLVDWARLQPRQGLPADLGAVQDGCLRGAPPCASWGGVREQLQAIASRGLGQGVVPEVLLVVHGVPDWAARAPSGCERAGEGARSRPMTAAGRRAYAMLLRELIDLGRETGARVSHVAPWNEPNHPAFVSPQRVSCDAGAPPRAPTTYAQLVRTARAALPRGVVLVLGELAGYDDGTPQTTGIREFVRALPDDVACPPGAVWGVHQFAGPRGTRGARSDDASRTLVRALDARGCRDAPVWITETGAGGAEPGRTRTGGEAGLHAACRGFARVLRRWDRAPRIHGVFQYTAREDPLHPVGLIDPQMDRAHPAARLLAAWAAAGPDDPQPGPGACG